MKFAWIQNDKIKDVAHANPTDIYHPDVAVFYDTQVPDDAAHGDGWLNGQLVKAPAPAALPDSPRTWVIDDIRNNLTLAERVKWDSDLSSFIKTAKIEFSIHPELAHATEVLQMLVDAGDISAESMTKILA